jgi:hypothetical protein
MSLMVISMSLITDRYYLQYRLWICLSLDRLQGCVLVKLWEANDRQIFKKLYP